MPGTVQLEPQVIPPVDETEDERARREALAAMAAGGLGPSVGELAAAPASAPGSTPTRDQQRLPEDAARAQAIGDAYRAAPPSTPQPRPSTSPTGGVIYPAGSTPPPTGNRNPAADAFEAARGAPAAAAPPIDRARLLAALQQRMGRQLSAPGVAGGRTANIDVSQQPRVQNPDGSVSNVRSMSFNEAPGREVLVPTVDAANPGRIMSDEQAIDAYRQTGRNLGTFATPEEATAYAQRLHEEQGALNLAPNATARMTSPVIDAARGAQPPGQPSWMSQQPPSASALPPQLPAAKAAAPPPSAPTAPPATTPQPAAPSGPDYTGVDVADRLLSPFRGLARGLMAVGGVGGGVGPTHGEEARARDAQAEQRAQRQAASAAAGNRASADQGLARERLDLERQRLGMQGEDMAARRALAARSASASEEAQSARAQQAMLGAQLQTRRADAQIAGMRSEQERQAAMDSPESGISRADQGAVRFLVGALPPEARARFTEQFGEIESMPSSTIRQVVRPSLLGAVRDQTDRRGRARGTGGGGGANPNAVARADMGTDADPFMEPYMRLTGASREQAAAALADTGGGRSSPRTRAISLVQGQQRANVVQAEQSRVTGWVRRPDAPRLPANEAGFVRRLSRSDAEFQQAYARLRENLPALTAEERAIGRTGNGSVRYRQVNADLEIIRRQVGNINEAGHSLGASESLHGEIPGLEANVTADAILRNVQAIATTKHGYVAAVMDQMGYEPAGAEGGQRRGGPARAAAPVSSGGQLYTLRSGRRVELTEAQAAQARERGILQE